MVCGCSCSSQWTAPAGQQDKRGSLAGAPVPLLRHVFQVRCRPGLAPVSRDIHPYHALAAASPGVAPCRHLFRWPLDGLPGSRLREGCRDWRLLCRSWLGSSSGCEMIIMTMHSKIARCINPNQAAQMSCCGRGERWTVPSISLDPDCAAHAAGCCILHDLEGSLIASDVMFCRQRIRQPSFHA